MKNCMQCGAPASDETALCPKCGHAFSYVGPGPGAPAPPPATVQLRDRPDGGLLIGLGWSGICIGILLFLIGAIQVSGRYGRPNLDDAMAGTLVGFIAGGLFHLGLLLLLVGLVIRAIWFIPGPDRKGKSPNPLP